jgi:hypothetical protein
MKRVIEAIFLAALLSPLLSMASPNVEVYPFYADIWSIHPDQAQLLAQKISKFGRKK